MARTRAVVVALVLVGCAPVDDAPKDAVDTGAPGTTTGAPTAPGTPAVDDTTWSGGIEILITSRCAGCHAGDPPAGELDLAVDAFAAIVEVPSVQSADLPLVQPGDHLYSYLWHKVNGSQSIAGGSGTNMPLGGWLDDADIERLAIWIDRGCP